MHVHNGQFSGIESVSFGRRFLSCIQCGVEVEDNEGCT